MSVTVLWGSHAVQPRGIANNLCIASYSLEKWSSVVAEPGGIIAMDIEFFCSMRKDFQDVSTLHSEKSL